MGGFVYYDTEDCDSFARKMTEAGIPWFHHRWRDVWEGPGVRIREGLLPSDVTEHLDFATILDEDVVFPIQDGRPLSRRLKSISRGD